MNKFRNLDEVEKQVQNGALDKFFPDMKELPKDITQTVDLLLEGDKVVLNGLIERIKQRDKDSISVVNAVVAELLERRKIATEKYKQAMSTLARLEKDPNGKDKERKSALDDLENATNIKTSVDSALEELDR